MNIVPSPFGKASRPLDVARGAYAQLPLPMRRRLGALLRFVPVSARYGRTYRAWRRRIEAAEAEPAKAAAIQAGRLLDVVRLAISASPGHRDRLAPVFGREGPRDADALLARWAEVPVLTGDEVVTGGERFCTVPAERLDIGLTGGSSGRPVRFYLDRGRAPIEYAFVHHAWRRAGFRPGLPRAVFRGVETAGAAHMHYEPALAELRCSVFHLSDSVMAGYLQEIQARRIAHLHGYPSALAIFADHVLRSCGPLDTIAGVLPTSERLPAHLRRSIERAFPAAILAPTYGLSEKVAFATEVEGAPDVYEFDPLYGYTELVDIQGRAVVREGERGRIVSTGLLFPGMPLIRYETGDEADLVALPSRANGARLQVRRIVPRHGHEYLIGRSGILMPLSGMLQVDEEILGVGEFQFVQDTPGAVTLRVVPRSGPVPDFGAYLARANAKARGEITLAIEIVDSLPTTVRGKRKFIDQRLPEALRAEALAAADRGPS